MSYKSKYVRNAFHWIVILWHLCKHSSMKPAKLLYCVQILIINIVLTTKFRVFVCLHTHSPLHINYSLAMASPTGIEYAPHGKTPCPLKCGMKLWNYWSISKLQRLEVWKWIGNFICILLWMQLRTIMGLKLIRVSKVGPLLSGYFVHLPNKIHQSCFVFVWQQLISMR